MEVQFETAFVQALKKHASIKKLVQRKVDMIIEAPATMGEPLKGNWQGFYSCPVKRNFIIIYLYCRSCRKKGDDAVIKCHNCHEFDDETLKFILLGPHDKTYRI
ncbi:MAG: type II toxin-antitoxin system mRNA interferase toxin, RelE/StbE family [Thermodesulfobacteriota bacterium]|nr:type II toxin-antitoxin system mRNA interferase toxin, RelE/StbE family [Thermodesulfobacteriota bacterium]